MTKEELKKEVDSMKDVLEKRLADLEEKAKDGLNTVEAVSKVKIEEVKARLDELGDDAEELFEVKMKQLKDQYQLVEDRLEAEYKGLLAKIRLFFAKLLKMFKK